VTLDHRGPSASPELSKKLNRRDAAISTAVRSERLTLLLQILVTTEEDTAEARCGVVGSTHEYPDGNGLAQERVEEIRDTGHRLRTCASPHRGLAGGFYVRYRLQCIRKTLAASVVEEDR
jgi:hypothetical protein